MGLKKTLFVNYYKKIAIYVMKVTVIGQDSSYWSYEQLEGSSCS